MRTSRYRLKALAIAAGASLVLLTAALEKAPDTAAPTAPAADAAAPATPTINQADAAARRAVVAAKQAFKTAIAAARNTPIDDASALRAAAEPLLAHLDLTRITRLLLPRHWRTATGTERLRLEQALVKHLLNRHAPALRDLHDWRLELMPRRTPASDRAPLSAEVPVAVSARGLPELRLTLRLSNTHDGWRLYDATLFGMSVVAMVRSSLSDLAVGAQRAELIATRHP